MSKNYDIIQNIEFLHSPSEDVKSVEEAQDIINRIMPLLKKPNRFGIATIQIGINKKVAVINDGNGGFFHLINPVVLEKQEEFVFFREGCLSLPDKFVNTKRYGLIKLKASRINETNSFIEQEMCFVYRKHNDVYSNLMCIAVQHELDHFDGKLITDVEVKGETIVKNEKIGRNDKCPCGSGKKYKRCCSK